MVDMLLPAMDMNMPQELPMEDMLLPTRAQQPESARQEAHTNCRRGCPAMGTKWGARKSCCKPRGKVGSSGADLSHIRDRDSSPTYSCSSNRSRHPACRCAVYFHRLHLHKGQDS